MSDPIDKNVLGEPLKILSNQPETGFYRDGYCKTGPTDSGIHVVAAVVDQRFLDFTKSKGNDLQTPQPQFGFPGLKPGDRWCLCAARWKEAHDAGFSPTVVLEATHEKALKYISLELLKKNQKK
ncbi:MAG: DUF2237 domain-containing protein [Bdellovibrionaceae bacterium]|nr:DUF2237 domain-containing protein [Pseudobdellovibrionaceae bacterium]